MILLDTNVISELMRPHPQPSVLRWLDTQAENELATTTVTVAEIGAGLAMLPDGARRTELRRRAAELLQRGFAERTFGFDGPAAAVYADLFALRRKAGRHAPGFDLLIAAIAKSRGHAVATRNVGDFEGLGVVVVDPWQGHAADQD